MEIENKKTGERRIINNVSIFISRIMGNIFIDNENGIGYFENEWKKIEKPNTGNIIIDEYNTLIKNLQK